MIEMPGGGGLGDPRRRPVERVLADVRAGAGVARRCRARLRRRHRRRRRARRHRDRRAACRCLIVLLTKRVEPCW
ncbi:MAG: hypothetical protein WDO24_24080 [Pseudomonadota bacterium]